MIYSHEVEMMCPVTTKIAICPIPSKTRTAKPMLTAMLREIIMSMDLG